MHSRRNFIRQMGGAAAVAEWRWAPSRDGLGAPDERLGQVGIGRHSEVETLRAQFPTLQQRVNGRFLTSDCPWPKVISASVVPRVHTIS